MWLGREQKYNPELSKGERIYVALFGIPIVGLRIRARNVFSMVPRVAEFESILDAGSGTGALSFALGRRFPQAKVLGIDTDKTVVDVARHISRRIKTGNVSFAHTTIEDLQSENVRDLVVCVDVLEHIENDQKTLASLFDLTAPGGWLVLHVPARFRRYPIWKKCPNFDVPSHVRPGYDPDEIKRKVVQAGYYIVESGFTYGFWETLANNVGYMISRAQMKHRFLYALAFPFLHMMSLMGRSARPENLGAGVFVVAKKKEGRRA